MAKFNALMERYLCKQYRFVFFISTILLILIGCKEPITQYERPMDPWAFRSVLDKKPRMLTLALHPELFVAYDLANSQLYKIWKGGVFLEGTVFTNKKNIQPTTWGVPYQKNEAVLNKWQVNFNGKSLSDFAIRQKGYSFDNNQIWLAYELVHAKLGTVSINEKPEYVTDEQGNPGLERIFTVSDMPEATEIILVSEQGKFLMTENGTHQLLTYFDPIQEQFPPSLGEQYDHLGILRMETSDCYTCHEEINDNVGPSFTSIASKYNGDKNMYPYLMQKIREGGNGVWGEVMMNAHPDMEAEDIRPMLDYIITYAPKSPKE